MNSTTGPRGPGAYLELTKPGIACFVMTLTGVSCYIAVGGALGVLLAPHRGDITRRKISRAAEETKDQVVEKVEDLMVHRSEEDVHDEEKATS